MTCLVRSERGPLGAHGWKRNDESGALAHAAVAVDGALVLAHDSVRNGQSQTSALPQRLCREERIVDPRQVFVGYTGAGVADFGDNAAVVQARGDRQPASFGHRIAR